MRLCDAPAIGRVAFAAVLGVLVLVWSPGAAGQVALACSPDKTLNVTLTSTERGLAAPIVATHEAEVRAEFTGSTVEESLIPPPDVRVVARTRTAVDFIVPAVASLAMTVSWQQAIDPSNPASDPADPLTSCAASRVVTLPVEPARAGRAVKESGWAMAVRYGIAGFVIIPALHQPDLSPVEISLRTTSRERYPATSTAPRTMVVPMRTVDQLEYSTPLPSLYRLSLAKRCRFYLLACGRVFADVARLLVDPDALRRGIVQGGINKQEILLARTQPSLEAARYGVSITVSPGTIRAGPLRPFGYDIQVRQSGRLMARVRLAGRCADRRDSRGIFTQCRILKQSIQLR